jgi:hypothetical protein
MNLLTKSLMLSKLSSCYENKYQLTNILLPSVFIGTFPHCVENKNSTIFISIKIPISFSTNLRARARQGNWQPQRNRNFRELLSAWVEHMLLNGAAQIEETAMQLAENWETQLPGNGACQCSHNFIASWFPRVSCSIMRVRDSFVS